MQIPEPSVHLLLCRHAVEADGRLFMSEAGITQAPPSDKFEWYLAGTIDAQIGMIHEGGSLTLVDSQGESVDDKYTAQLRGDSANIGPEAQSADPSEVGHMAVALRLRDVSEVPPGLYAWQFQMAGLEQIIPFTVMEDNPDVTE